MDRTNGQKRDGTYRVDWLLRDILMVRKMARTIRNQTSELDVPRLYCDSGGDVIDTIAKLDDEDKELLKSVLIELLNAVDEIKAFTRKVSLDASFYDLMGRLADLPSGLDNVDDAVDFLRDLKDTERVTDEDRAETIHQAWLQLCMAAAEEPGAYDAIAEELKPVIGITLGTGDDYYGMHH